MKGFFKFIFGLVIVLAIVIGGLYVVLSLPKKVDVKWTAADLESYNRKVGASIGSQGIKPAGMEDMLFGNFTSSGTLEVEGVVTPAEATAMVNSVLRDGSIFTDINMNFRDDGTMEVSGKLGPGVKDIFEMFPEAKKYIDNPVVDFAMKAIEGRPIYWRCSIERIDNNTFDGHTEELRIGMIPIPLAQAGEGLTEAGSAINNLLGKMEGFSCDAFSIDSEGLHFKGTIPDKLQYVNENPIMN